MEGGDVLCYVYMEAAGPALSLTKHPATPRSERLHCNIMIPMLRVIRMKDKYT